jgi:hypothetical protein
MAYLGRPLWPRITHVQRPVWVESGRWASNKCLRFVANIFIAMIASY